MSAPDFAAILSVLLRELVDGSPDETQRTFMLNRGDPGLLASLDRLSAAQASATHGGAPSVAAHVDHLRYGLKLLKAWFGGSPVPQEQVDWTASWRLGELSEEAWRSLRGELRREAAEWGETLRTPRAVNEVQAGYMAGSVAHVAYHFGAIRQLDRAARGPTAEDEARAEAALRER
jgi:hypothetical protein